MVAGPSGTTIRVSRPRTKKKLKHSFMDDDNDWGAPRWPFPISAVDFSISDDDDESSLPPLAQKLGLFSITIYIRLYGYFIWVPVPYRQHLKVHILRPSLWTAVYHIDPYENARNTA